MRLDAFDYDTYGRLIERLRETHSDLLFHELATTDATTPFFLLRHDVDLSPEAALAMASLEARLGVRATYFLLVSSDVYNLHCAEYCEVPARLVDMGHEVGLHYDLAAYGRRRDPRRAFEGERAALASLSGTPITAIAPHDPSPQVEDPFAAESALVHAYAVIETHEMTYISDSSGAWRDEAVAVLERSQLPPRMQVLVHPFFWAETSADRWERLDAFRESRHRTMDSWVRSVRNEWSRRDSVQEHDRRPRSPQSAGP